MFVLVLLVVRPVLRVIGVEIHEPEVVGQVELVVTSLCTTRKKFSSVPSPEVPLCGMRRYVFPSVGPKPSGGRNAMGFRSSAGVNAATRMLLYAGRGSLVPMVE